MSADIVIRVANLSKSYTIWSSPSARLHGPFWGRVGRLPFLPEGVRHTCEQLSHQSFRDFFALRDISFHVEKGECVGVIGQNGSGKSTLLQIVAGVLDPTRGTAEVQGKVAALLELGSGFNPEFTGRENVYLNASVLGLSRAEIDRRYDEIAAFADIGDFIDQPIKTYSSGMVLRLAFAVQAVINPDILIVDEALAVGDEAFQRKCFARIKALQKAGTTIFFCSHATGVVVELCRRALLLDHGELLLDGPSKLVVAKYHKLLFAAPEKRESVCQEIRELNRKGADYMENLVRVDADKGAASRQRRSDERFDSSLVPKSLVSYPIRGALIEQPHITTLDGRRVNVLATGNEYVYTYRVRFLEPQSKVRFGMMIKTVSGYEVGGAASHTQDDGLPFVESGLVYRLEFQFRCLLQPGTYFLNAGVLGMVNSQEVYLHRLIDAVMFRVQPEPGLLATGVVDFLVRAKVRQVDPGDKRKEGQLVPASHDAVRT